MRKLLHLPLLILFFTAASFGQVNVNVNTKKPVPSKISEWENDPAIITLNLQNTTSNYYSGAIISLEVKDGSGNIVISSKDNNPSIPKFDIPAGPPEGSGVLMLNGHDVFNANAMSIDQDFNNTLITTNSLPEGSYDLCFSVKKSDGTVISTPSNACVFIEIRHPEPPALIDPLNRTVSQEYPQFIWSPIVGAPSSQNLIYELSIAPVLSGQNPRTAIEANNLLVSKRISATTYTYLPTDPRFDSFTETNSFVWQVQVLDKATNEPVGSNLGKSQIGQFTIAVTSQDTVDPGIITDPDVLDPGNFTLPMAKIEGQVQWTIGDPPKNNTSTGNGASGGQSGGTGNNSLIQNLPTQDYTQGSLQNLYYPIRETNVKVYTANGKELIGSATTDDQGNFSVSFVNMGSSDRPAIITGSKTYYLDKVKIVPEEPHFKFTQKVVELNKDENNNYEPQNVIGYKKTFKLTPSVYDYDTQEQIDNATVEILRLPKVYEQYPSLEGELKDNAETVEWRGKSLKLFKTISSGETANNLAVTDNLFIDSFLLKIYAEAYDTSEITIVEPGFNYDFNSKPEQKPTVYLTASLPAVEGKVVSKQNLTPLSNLSVKLIPDGSSTAKYSTRTNESGEFLISKIAVSKKPYTLKIEGDKTATHTEELYLDSRGTIIEKYPLKVDAVMFAVKGKVVDKNKNPIANAMLKWKSGGDPFYSDENGNFLTLSPPQQRELIVSKLGYLDEQLSVDIGGITEGAFDPIEGMDQFQNMLQGGSFGNSNFNFQALGIGGNYEPPANLFNGSSSDGPMQTMSGQLGGQSSDDTNTQSAASFFSAAMFANLNLGSALVSPDALDLGLVEVDKITGKLQVTVLNKSDNTPIENAKLISNDISDQTNSKGVAFISGTRIGQISFRVEPPSNKAFVPEEFNISVTQSLDTTKTTVKLTQGAMLSGKTKSDGSTLDSVKLRVDGRNDISVTSDAQGNYTLNGIPTGQVKIVATKQGYLGNTKSMNLSVGKTTQDFSLKNPGYKIEKIWGLEVEIEDHTSIGEDTLKVSGAFVNIPANTTFYPLPNYRLPFSDQLVQISHADSLAVIGSWVDTDKEKMPLKVFNFLFAEATAPDSTFRVTDFSNFSAINSDTISLDYKKTFNAELAKLGWEFVGDISHYVEPMKIPTPMIFSSDPEIISGGAQSQIESQFDSTKMMINEFPMIMDLSNSFIDTSGMHFSGYIRLDSLAGIDTLRLDIEDLWIDKTGTIRPGSKVNFSEAYAAIDSLYNLKIENVTLPRPGEGKMMGKLEFKLPKSEKSELTFSDLKFSTKRLYGGKFGMPGEGININNTVFFRTNKNGELDFAYDEGNERYYLSGSGYIKMNEDSLDGALGSLLDSLKFNNFTFASDGDMNYTVRTDLHRDFGNVVRLDVHTFDLDINSRKFSATGRAYFKNIPFVQGNSGFVYKYSADFGVPLLDSLKVVINSPIAHVEAEGEGVETTRRIGFVGDGSLSMFGGSVKGEVDFFDYYYKPTMRGADTTYIDSVRADFTAEIGVPIGDLNIVEADGSFIKDKNTGGYFLDISGKVRLGLASPIALNPVDITIRNGNRITGSADLRFLGLRFADAQLRIDKPKQYFYLRTNLGVEIIPGITPSSSVTQRLVISGQPNNNFWFADFTAKANIPRIANGNFGFLLGSNVDITNYGYNPPSRVKGLNATNFTGALARANVNIGNTRSQAPWHTLLHTKAFKKTVAKVSAKGWFSNRTKAYTYLNPNTTAVGFYIGNNWTAGGIIKGESDFVPTIRVGATINVGGSVAGGYTVNDGFYYNGQLNGRAKAFFGSCGGCQIVRVCTKGLKLKGIHVCQSVNVDVAFSTGDGLSIKLKL